MKSFSLIACLFFTNVTFAAVTVEATGKGDTQEEALRRAKIEAVEKVTGSFNLGHRKTDGRKYSEEIDDYVSGIITESEVLSSQRTQQHWIVTIRAVVDETKPSVFQVERDKPLIDDRIRSKISEMNNRKTIVEKISETPALHFSTTRVDVSPFSSVSKIRITGHVSWQHKWVNDFQNFAKYAGKESVDKSYQSNVYYGNSFYHPVLVAGSVIMNPAKTTTRSGNTYCFTDGNQIDAKNCYDIGIELENVSKYNVNYFTIILKDSNGSVLSQMRYTTHNLRMVEFYPAGSSKKNNYIFFNSSNYFETDTTVIQTNKKVPANIEFLLDNSLATRVASYSIEVK
jgi:hypothetical protein